MSPTIVRLSAILLIVSAGLSILSAQEPLEPVILTRSVTGPHRMVERSNWLRYDNGTYTGLVHREVRTFLRPISDSSYEGEIYILEETLRDLQSSARALDLTIPVELIIDSSGGLRVLRDQGFPSLRGFPAFPPEPVVPGAVWVAQGSRSVDPRNEGISVRLPIIVRYEYRGQEVYKGIPVHRVFAKYATRYRAVGRPASFASASGTHEVDILIRASDGLPLLMRDRLDETFTWPDGSTTRFRGFTLTFSEGTLPLDRTAVVAELRGVLGAPGAPRAAPGPGASPGIGPGSAGPGGPLAAAQPEPPQERGPAPRAGVSEGQIAPPSVAGEGVATAVDSGTDAVGVTPVGAAAKDLPAPETVQAPAEDFTTGMGDFEQATAGSVGIEVAPVPEGVRLTVRDLRFAADTDSLLPEERVRLNLLAQALLGVGERAILVEGHTAAVGRPAGELGLSVARAKRIVEELSGRGIPAERFLYKGWGGTKPVADNATEEGRARNRRVEITILE